MEFDGVAQDGKILNYAISEHVENAGVHSGDATLVLPAQKLYVETIRRVKRISQQIVEALQVRYYIFQSIFSLYSVYIQCEDVAILTLGPHTCGASDHRTLQHPVHVARQ